MVNGFVGGVLGENAISDANDGSLTRVHSGQSGSKSSNYSGGQEPATPKRHPFLNQPKVTNNSHAQYYFFSVRNLLAER